MQSALTRFKKQNAQWNRTTVSFYRGCINDYSASFNILLGLKNVNLQ